MHLYKRSQKKNNVRFVRKNKRWRGRIRHAPHVQKNRDVCVAYKKETKVTYPVARYDMGLPYKKKLCINHESHGIELRQ